MNTGVDYKLFYEILLNLREIFYHYGRIDDANTKLDEISKIILLAYFYGMKNEKFSLKFVKQYALNNFNNENNVARALIKLFENISNEKIFTNVDGTSIFGSNKALNIQSTEDIFAQKMISEIEKIDFINLVKFSNLNDFDIINECFGHFVRENFRNNKEDAQYMTPSEITLPILDMVFNDFVKENYFSDDLLKDFTIMDPTCGVGTLLLETSRKYTQTIKTFNIESKFKDEILTNFFRNNILGQDKVDRMVRLSKINTLLMGGNIYNIWTGNSISESSEIDKYTNKVDFIFTNPPFGAEYKIENLNPNNFMFLKEFKEYNFIPSEIAMFLKCLNLIKENGKLAIILPDSVFSAKGIYSLVRNLVLKHFRINAIIEMPSVTFAQAGTRTKTSILYLTKQKPLGKPIVMATCKDIGYLVKEKMGVPIKIKSGNNEMKSICETYNNITTYRKLIKKKPSVTSIIYNELVDDILNPSFYSYDRIETLEILENYCSEDYEIKKLSDIVEFCSIGRKNLTTSEFIKHISVLHVNNDGIIDFKQVEKFEPISKGRLCKQDEILFSKINPKIPRISVVPRYEKELVCSNEFEIMKVKADIGPFALCYALRTEYVAKQIEDLTSGTSSSHSRIKREQLADIKIIYPKSKKAKKIVYEINEKIKQALLTKYEMDNILNLEMLALNNLVI